MNLVYTNNVIPSIDEIRTLGLLAYGQHAPVLEQGWDMLRTNLEKESTWTELLDTSIPIICRHDSKIVGMAYLVLNGHPTDIYESEWCYIRMVGVHPDYSGKGIARKLTLLCIEEAKLRGEKKITLHTSEFMDAARHIYQSLGFKIIKEIPPRFGKKYWVFGMDL